MLKGRHEHAHYRETTEGDHVGAVLLRQDVRLEAGAAQYCGNSSSG